MYVSLDLETTGFDHQKDHIIEFGAVRFNLNGETERLQFFVKSPIPIPPIVTHITNIRDEDIADALPFEDHIAEIQAFIGDFPIIGHNIGFDTGFLRAKGIEVTGPDYDTHILAGMLLPNLPSYSLEVISQTLGLNHEDKHRALDDAIAAMELFLELIKRFESIPSNLLDKIKQLSAKSTWPLNRLVQDLEHRENQFAPLTPPRLIKPSKISAETILQKTAPLIDLAPPYEELIQKISEQANKETFVAIPYETFRRVEHHISDQVAKIDCKNQYISLERFEKIQHKETFQEDEISAIIKCLIWLRDTKTGLLSEMRIIGKEKYLIDRICVDENQTDLSHETFYQKAHNKETASASLCTHHYILNELQNAAEKNLILIDLNQFKHRLHRNLSIFLKEDLLLEAILDNLRPQEHPTIQALKEKTKMIFALLTKTFDDHNDKNEYSPRCNISPTIRDLSSWQNAAETFKGLFEISKELKALDNEENFLLLQKWKKALADLNQVFLGQACKSSLMWLEPNYKDQTVCLRRIPGNIEEELQKFLEGFKKFQIIGENLELEKALTDKYELEIIEEKNPNLQIFLTENALSEPQIDHKLLEIMRQTPGRTAIIVNSKKRLHELTLFFSREKLPIVSQLTSSTGKLKAKFQEEQDQAVMLLTPNVWLNLEDYDAFDRLFIYKIPFEAPGKPEIIAESEGKQNAFIEVYLPKAAAALTAIINRLEKNHSQKSVTIIDERILKKDYGATIKQKLTKLGEIKTSDLF